MFTYRNSNTGQVVQRREHSARLDRLANWVLVDAPEPAGERAPSAPERPGKGDAKPVWVAYVAATSDLSEAEAGDMTKAELQELAES